MRVSRQKYESGDVVTFLQVHNLLPFIGALITVVGAYYLLSGRVDLQAQKMEYITEANQSCQVRMGSLETEIRQQALDIKELQATREVRGTSVYKAPTPTEKP